VALGAQKPPLDFVNALVGTAPLDKQELIGNAPPPGEELYTGMTSPAAVLPHGITYLGPINKNLELSYPAGVGMSYNYLHRTIFGFTNGMPGIVVMPVVGPWTVPPERSGSVYDKAKEKATPGYYRVYFDDFHVNAEMTATYWTGIYRFTFPRSRQSHIVMDLGFEGGSVEINDDHTLRGCGERPIPGGVSGTYLPGKTTICFVAVFSKPFQGFGTFKEMRPEKIGEEGLLGDSKVTPGGKSESGPYAGAYLDFSTSEGEQVLVKTAAADSYESAEKRLTADIPGWDFDGIHQRAREVWAKLLNTIEVKGGTEHERMLFYSNLFHSFASPRLVARQGEPFRAFDGKTKIADYDRYGPVPFWDTGRDQVVTEPAKNIKGVTI
jgi:putative alpha-1,2-mannosidase